MYAIIKFKGKSQVSQTRACWKSTQNVLNCWINLLTDGFYLMTQKNTFKKFSFLGSFLAFYNTNWPFTMVKCKTKSKASLSSLAVTYIKSAKKTGKQWVYCIISKRYCSMHTFTKLPITNLNWSYNLLMMIYISWCTFLSC